MTDEKTPLIKRENEDDNGLDVRRSKPSWPKRISNTVVGTVRVFISTVLAPGYYVVACFYDEKGHFSLSMPFVRIGRSLSRKQRRKKKQAVPVPGHPSMSEKSTSTSAPSTKQPKREQTHDTDRPRIKKEHSRSPSSSSVSSASSIDTEASEESKSRRSIRIKTVNEDALRKRRQRRGEDGSQKSSRGTQQPQLTAENIKSPKTPSSSSGLMKYPRAPAPPRPLVPRRQPSYTMLNSSSTGLIGGKKTLVIDLDETLIHSMAKGGRMSTGHMVEVKLQSPVGVGGAVLGPQVPILYYVHKRPHCDEFLRKISKWYNLIVFTASVQEYADPVIDWLELERKYFDKRYYRQDCTFRNGAYIKDLSHVEADLSKVMILDNSPMSYIFHEDNAIPIEGWISDPTDNDLLHLIPLLEGLQYTTDVRALLSLRLGEASPAS